MATGVTQTSMRSLARLAPPDASYSPRSRDSAILVARSDWKKVATARVGKWCFTTKKARRARQVRLDEPGFKVADG